MLSVSSGNWGKKGHVEVLVDILIVFPEFFVVLFFGIRHMNPAANALSLTMGEVVARLGRLLHVEIGEFLHLFQLGEIHGPESMFSPRIFMESGLALTA